MSSYRALLARPGARTLALACALAWVSFGGLSLGIVLAVESESGSFATAGAALGAFGVGVALLAPWRGSVVDRHRDAVMVFAAANAIGLALVLVGAALRWPVLVLVALAAAAGAVAPPVIALARALWPPVAGPRLTRAGHSLNAALGDLGTVLGPALVGATAAIASGSAALGVLIGGPLLASILLRRLAIDTPTRANRRSALIIRESAGLRVLVATGLALGLALGALEIIAPLVGAHAGNPSIGAVPLCGLAAGSVAGSLWSGRARVSSDRRSRFLAGLFGLALVLALGQTARSVAGLTIVLLFGGACYGVVNVATFELLDTVVPNARAIEAFTWLTSANALGLAMGSVLAGAAAGSDLGATLAIPGAATLIAAVFAVHRRSFLEREEIRE